MLSGMMMLSPVTTIYATESVTVSDNAMKSTLTAILHQVRITHRKILPIISRTQDTVKYQQPLGKRLTKS